MSKHNLAGWSGFIREAEKLGLINKNRTGPWLPPPSSLCADFYAKAEQDSREFAKSLSTAIACHDRVKQLIKRNTEGVHHVIHYIEPKENTMQDNKEFLKKIEDTASRINQFNASIPTDRHDAILGELNYLLREHKNLLLQKPGAQPVNKQALQPFDLEKALAGHPVVTRDGRSVEVVGSSKRTYMELVVFFIDGQDKISSSNTKGESLDGHAIHDLFMAPRMRTVYINQWTCGGTAVYDTAQKAILQARTSPASLIAHPVEIPDVR